MASAMPDSANSANHAYTKRKTQASNEGQEQEHDEENDALLPSLFHRGQLVVRNEGSVTRDYLGEFGELMY